MTNVHDIPSRHEQQRLDLSIVPGKSLGWFRLGASIWDVINFLREQSRVIPSVDLKYAEESPIITDLFLSLPANGINMRFDGLIQRLKVIEVYDFSKLRLTYQDSEVSSSKVAPTFLSIYKIFGPTYPGELDKTRKEYTLNYPGVSFVFPIPEEHISLYISSTDLPLELPDGTSPLLSRLYAFHGSSFRTANVPSLARSASSENRVGNDIGEIESVVAELKRGITINFLDRNHPSPISKEILLNVTTPQDLLVDIGSALRVFFKEEDKMRIHSENIDDMDNVDSNAQENRNVLSNGTDARNREEDGHPIDYFYNYFQHGFDVLFDGITHRCKKIILHGNVPGHYDFQRYKRCPYKILLHSKVDSSPDINEVAKLEVFNDDDNQLTSSHAGVTFITAEMKIDKIRELFGPLNGRPLIFNRGAGGQNPFGPTELSGHDGAVFEVMKNGYVATITLF
ncbi:8248_t:CDS:1 [Acaulospora morrowiae]|uniref:8248_t:CDS:1 n=1 Tax=Acaulospora morrowiae TaxID=94023 RepID=A0A9N9EX85_9GLOM|nr:8248_t:CDS:1 [Acaulospora morrowiae]